MDELLTVDEAAERLGTSPRFPRRLITERRITFVRVGRHVRIPAAALEAYVRAQHRAADGEDVVSRGRPFGSIRRLPSGATRSATWGRTVCGGRRLGPSRREPTPDGGSAWSRARSPAASGWTPSRTASSSPRTRSGGSPSGRGLSERSIELYSGLLRLHIEPHLGEKGIRKITPPDVRTWRQGLLDNGARAEHGVEGVPAAAGRHEHRLRRRADPAEPVPDQGRRRRASGRAADPDARPGDGAGRRDRAAVPAGGAARRVRLAAVGRADGAAEDRLRSRRRPGPRRAVGRPRRRRAGGQAARRPRRGSGPSRSRCGCCR